MDCPSKFAKIPNMLKPVCCAPGCNNKPTLRIRQPSGMRFDKVCSGHVNIHGNVPTEPWPG